MPRRGENIRKRKDGRWEGRYVVITEEGSRKYHSVYASTYTQVKEKLKSAKMEKAENITTKTAQISVLFYQTVAEEWLEEIRKKCKYSTYAKYKSTYYKYVLPGIQQLQEISFNKSSICLTVDNASEMSNSTKKSIRGVIHEISEYATDRYHLPKLKCDLELSAVKNKGVEIFSESEQKRLIQILYENMDLSKMGILLCLSTGLRVGELCALKWSDIDFDEGCLSINRTVQRISIDNSDKKTDLMVTSPKSIHSERTIPLSEHMLQLLKEYESKNPEDYIWNQDTPLDPRTCQNRFKSILKKSNIKNKNFHVLRHTFATNCINNGMDVKCLSEILGHSDVKITLNRYVHPSMETKRQYMNSLFSVYGQYMGQPENDN